MINIDKESVEAMFEANKPAQSREALMNQARDFLYNNQECYVAQWVLQNPFANINDYRLKFVYNDTSLMGYTVEMEKIDVQ